MSKLLNSNFRLKIGRVLYGYSGACRILGQLRVDHLLSKALRSKKQVVCYRAVGLDVKFYAK